MTKNADGNVVYSIEVFREEDGQFAAEFRSGDNHMGGMGEYSSTPIGALANLCATLIKIEEDSTVLNQVKSEVLAFAVRLTRSQQELPPEVARILTDNQWELYE